MANLKKQRQSIIKRAKMQTLERVRSQIILRKNLPVLTRTQVRRFRLPYHEAILEEIEENNCWNAAEFIRQLIVLQEEYFKEHNYDALLQTRPKLLEKNDQLDVLSAGLQNAEMQHFDGNIDKEIDEFLKMGVHFGFYSADWTWLAEQLFAQALKISDENSGMLPKKALSCYLYGKYLFIQDVEIETCIDFLNVAKGLSEDKDWTAFKVLKLPQKTIYIEVCTLLYKILSKMVEVVIKCNPVEALQICKVAKERCINACLGRADIFFLQGRCEMEVGNARKGAECFKKSFLMYKAEGEVVKACESRIYLALAYLEIGDWERTYNELHKLLVFAEKNNMQNFVGLAHLYVGQYYLNQGTPENATPILIKALNIFHELNDITNREFVSNLAAVSRGQEIMEKYINMILKCEYDDSVKRSNYLLKLVAWKDLREPFWEDISEAGESVEEESVFSAEGLSNVENLGPEEESLYNYEELGEE